MGNYTYGSITVFGPSNARDLRAILARVERRLVHKNSGDKEYRRDNVHYWLSNARKMLRAIQHRNESWGRDVYGPLTLPLYGNYSYIEAGDVARAIAEELAARRGGWDSDGCTLLWRDDNTRQDAPNVEHYYFSGLAMEARE